MGKHEEEVTAISLLARSIYFCRILLATILLAGVGVLPAHLPCRAAPIKVTLTPQNAQQDEARKLLIEGAALLKNKQPFKARPILDRALRLWPEEAHLHYVMGGCHQESGNYQQAIAEYEQALQLKPDLYDCLADMATCYQLLNQYSQAVQYFSLYLQRKPDAQDAEQIKGMIKALIRQSRNQVESDPQGGEYLSSALKDGRFERWPRMPIKVYIANGTDEKGRPAAGFHESFNHILMGALDTWVKASDYRIAYLLVDDANNADMVCTWTDKPNFLKGGTSVEQGAARVTSRQSRMPGVQDILRVHVIILLVNPNNGKFLNAEEVKKTCLHELGHAFGIAGHSTNNRDVMFYSESPAAWAALTKRDKNTIAKLYADYPQFSWTGTPPLPRHTQQPNWAMQNNQQWPPQQIQQWQQQAQPPMWSGQQPQPSMQSLWQSSQ